MKPLNKVITNKDTSFNPIWIMRQAGRYLPEFKEIRKENPNFISLCLNDILSSKALICSKFLSISNLLLFKFTYLIKASLVKP